jgi:glycosyltransferase involved in cell wall biosynthesis
MASVSRRRPRQSLGTDLAPVGDVTISPPEPSPRVRAVADITRATANPAPHGPYVLITPARNEAEFVEETIRSVLRQTILPLRWVIVSDGSTDGTDHVVRAYTAVHDWIELVRAPERAERNFAGKAAAFHAGYVRVKDLSYEIIGNLDADISFDETYFAFLLGKFAADPRLGVAGTPFVEATVDAKETYDYRLSGIEHVSGACQMFRRECFEAIGGYRPIPSGGIDLIAVLSARAQGWRTQTFLEQVCRHHRKIGGAQLQGARERFHRGRMDYLLGSHPAWEVGRSIYQMRKRPYYVFGGLLILAGYLWTALRGTERTIPHDLMTLRRHDQLRRLKGLLRGRHAPVHDGR